MHEAQHLRAGFDPPAFSSETDSDPQRAAQAMKAKSHLESPDARPSDPSSIGRIERNLLTHKFKSEGDEALALKARGFAACELTEITKLIEHPQPAKSSFTAHFCLILSKRNSNSIRICTIGSF